MQPAAQALPPGDGRPRGQAAAGGWGGQGREREESSLEGAQENCGRQWGSGEPSITPWDRARTRGPPRGTGKTPGEGPKVSLVTHKSPMFKIQDGGCMYWLAGRRRAGVGEMRAARRSDAAATAGMGAEGGANVAKLGRENDPRVFWEVPSGFLAPNFGRNAMNLWPPLETKKSVLQRC